MRRVAFGAMLAAAIGLPSYGAGAAVTESKEGSDVSTANSWSWLQVCDKEADSHGVHNDIVWWNNASTGNFMRDGDGANNGCPQTNWLQGNPFLKHRVVEEVNFSGDQFGPWKWAG